MHKITRLFSYIIVSLLAVISVNTFFAPNAQAYADTTYSVTFTQGDNVISTINKNAGDTLTEGELPSITPSENYIYTWMYYGTDGINRQITLNGDASHIIIPNINSDIVVWVLELPDRNKTHEVTFNLPDGTSLIKTVLNGDTVEGPDMQLGFFEKMKYDKSLENITEDTTINVSIDYSLKYVFMAICGVLLVGSLVVIVAVVFKAMNVPDDDDDEDEEIEKDNA